MPPDFTSAARALHGELAAVLAAPFLTEDADPLAPLRASLSIQNRAAALVDAAAAEARAKGATWQDIGTTLGTTRQAAFQRFGRPIDPRTGDAMTTTPLPEARGLARAAVENLAAGHWAAVTSTFDGRMRDGLTEEGLAAAWAQVIGTVGAFQGLGETAVSRAADITVTNTPLAFEAGDFVARIAFRDDRSVAGLFILPPDTATEG